MPTAPAPAIDPAARWRLIAEAAWLRFVARGHVHGHHEQDWLDAEREIDARLAGAPAGPVDTCGFKPQVKGHDNLEIIEGIGPKIADLLVKGGIAGFPALAATTPETLRAVLAKAGNRYAMANPDTWPEQAALAAQGRWADLLALQKSLTAGRR
jgi:predicted flap endonuclease-1-like 5' DNA nuclease